MTCIVAKPGHMASDSRDTGFIKTTCTKMFVRHGYLVGGAGDSAALNMIEHVAKAWPRTLSVEALTRWVHRNHDSGKVNFDDCELVIATRTKVFVVDGRAVRECRVGAVGSGAGFALGYLEARPADLPGAVQAAIKYDPYCAGPIREEKCPA